MNYQAVLKRLLPFAATFFVAVFITSFFVDLRGPRFGEWRMRRYQEYQRMRCENEQLRNENLRLRNELQNKGFDIDELRMEVAPPAPPLAPMPPMKLRHRSE